MGRHAQTKRPVVLVVEGEAEARARLARELTLGGFTVWLAGGGREALTTYRRHGDDIDLILVGATTPSLDGPQTLAALRQFDPHARAVFLGDGEYTREELLGLGAAQVLEGSSGSDGQLARALWCMLPARR